MIYYKTKEEILLLRKSNELLSKAHAEVAKYIRAGVSTLRLDKIAEEYIKDNDAKPAFLGYRGFPNTLCVSVNDVVVHGIPSKYELRDGDIVSIDCGVILSNYYGDCAYTYEVGEVSEKIRRLLSITKESLELGIKAANTNNRIGDIGNVIQSFVESKGYSVVREMTGHGIGRNLHESPEIPNYGKRGSGKKIFEGMVLAIEPMINIGKKEVKLEKDGWTVRTVDGEVSAHYEHSVAIVDGVAQKLSTFKYIEEILNTKR